jgi:hypothetical protein
MAETPTLLRGLRNINCPHCEPRRAITQARLIDPISLSVAELERHSGGLTHHRGDSVISQSPYDIDTWAELTQQAQAGPSGSDETAVSARLSYSHNRSGDSNDSTSGSVSATGSDPNPKNSGKRLSGWISKRIPLKNDSSGIPGKASTSLGTTTFKKSTGSGKPGPLPSSLRYNFTATASSLLLWTRTTLVRFSLPSLTAFAYNVTRNLRFVAGGNQLIAVISADDTVSMFNTINRPV